MLAALTLQARVQVAAEGQQGRFSLGGLPPGEFVTDTEMLKVVSFTQTADSHFCMLVLPDGTRIPSNILEFEVRVPQRSWSFSSWSNPAGFSFASYSSSSSGRFSFTSLMPEPAPPAPAALHTPGPRFSFNAGQGSTAAFSYEAWLPASPPPVAASPGPGYSYASRMNRPVGFSHGAFMPSSPPAAVPVKNAGIPWFSHEGNSGLPSGFEYRAFVPSAAIAGTQVVAASPGFSFDVAARGTGFSFLAGIPPGPAALSAVESGTGFSFAAQAKETGFSSVAFIPGTPSPVLKPEASSSFSFRGKVPEAYFSFAGNAEALRFSFGAEGYEEAVVEPVVLPRLNLPDLSVAVPPPPREPERIPPLLRISADRTVAEPGQQIRLVLNIEDLKLEQGETAVVWLEEPPALEIRLPGTVPGVGFDAGRLLFWRIGPQDLAGGVAVLALDALVRRE
jgi:hypothetical protein